MAASENRFNDAYFNEDVVYRYNRKGNLQYGLVLENSELYSSDENSDNEEYGRLKSGHIRVAWHPKGCEEVMHEKKVGLADRSLMPGDVVRQMIKGKDTQRGYCRYIDMSANVQIYGTNLVIANIQSAKLTPLEEFSPDIVVCLDSWVGGIRQVNSSLHLKFNDGSRCVVTDLDNFSFSDADEKHRRDGEFNRADFYPGQALNCPMTVLAKANWGHITKELKSSQQNPKPGKVMTVTVEKVQVDSVNVHWQCKAYSKEGAGGEKEQPKHIISGDDLKRLKMINVFEPCSLQIGDRNYYTLEENDVIITKDLWRRMQKDKFPPLPPSGKSKSLLSPRKVPSKDGGDGDEDATMSSASVSPAHLAPPVPASGSTSPSPTHLAPPSPLPLRRSDTDDWDTDDTGSFSDTASLSSTCSNTSQGKKKKGPALVTKVLKTKKLRRARKRNDKTVNVKPGDRLVVETLSTSSVADVVWQDGSIEKGISSIMLYPIHHLDDKEFFPGDFVVENKEDALMQVYGVVQSVDHAGRTSRVKWFKTYTSTDDPNPTVLEDTEVSVYDLKDHPDFQYRPGTVVIRVANFEGEDAVCTAGQVLDNYPEGRVQVWWVDNHVSMCWPQDLYRVGEYDSDEGELWDTPASDASWETESEDCYIADVGCPDEEMDENTLKPKLGANIEKARIAMSRLEEIFTQNPALQTTGVMRQLLDVYKDCRYLDKLMGTSFFHESHFQGLLERVRERGRSNVAQRVADQVSRLFRSGESDDQTTSSTESTRTMDDSGCVTNNKDSSSSPSDSLTSAEFLLCENLANLERQVTAAASIAPLSSSPSSNGQRSYADATRQRSSSTPPSAPEDLRSSNVCVKLCSLIKGQLLNALQEVTTRFGGQMTLSQARQEANLSDSPVTPPLTSLEDKAAEEEHQVAAEAPPKEALPEEKMEAPLAECAETEVPMEAESSLPNGHVERPKAAGEGFIIEEAAPNNHKFMLTMFQPTEPKLFFQTVSKEHKLLRNSLPEGICVKGYENRMDLFSVMIKGPAKTPYEDGLFFFDFQLSSNYPKAPPVCHYVSYCSDRLNPNLYEDGKVCVSLLGTWSGKGTEVWTLNSTLLQVIVSIQGLILVSEPYFNEAGYEKQKGSQQGRENSRMYNEMVVLKHVQALSKMLLQPPSVFKKEIMEHFNTHAYKLIDRLETWLKISEQYNDSHPLSPTTPTTFREVHGEIVSSMANIQLPEFPLIPASKGFCITLRKSLVAFREVLTSVGIVKEASTSSSASCTTSSASTGATASTS